MAGPRTELRRGKSLCVPRRKFALLHSSVYFFAHLFATIGGLEPVIAEETTTSSISNVRREKYHFASRVEALSNLTGRCAGGGLPEQVTTFWRSALFSSPSRLKDFTLDSGVALEEARELASYVSAFTNLGVFDAAGEELDLGVFFGDNDHYNSAEKKELQLPAWTECALGAVVLLLQSVHADEYDRGMDRGRELFEVARSIWDAFVGGAASKGGRVFFFFEEDLLEENSSRRESSLNGEEIVEEEFEKFGPHDVYATAFAARLFSMPGDDDDVDVGNSNINGNIMEEGTRSETSGENASEEEEHSSRRGLTAEERPFPLRWNVPAIARTLRLFERILYPVDRPERARKLLTGETKTADGVSEFAVEQAVRDDHYYHHSSSRDDHDRSFSSSPQKKLKLYVYDMSAAAVGAVLEEGGEEKAFSGMSPKELAFSGRYLAAVGEGLLNCQFGMYGTEVAYHRYFQRFHRVFDPEEADLFFVPSYFKCVELVNWVDGFDKENLESRVLLEQVVAYLHGVGPWYRRHNGADHVFLFSWGRFPCAIPSRGEKNSMDGEGSSAARTNFARTTSSHDNDEERGTLKNDTTSIKASFSTNSFAVPGPWSGVLTGQEIRLQVEDRCEDINGLETTLVEKNRGEPTLQPHRDIIIPGHMDGWRAKELQIRNKPLRHRDIFLTFHGRSAQNADSYANVTVRTEIAEQFLEGCGSGGNNPEEGESSTEQPNPKEDTANTCQFPDVSVGGFVGDYHERMGSSIFCLAPRGITPWTIHLYVSVLVGCIPVLLSDWFRLPFEREVPYDEFIIRWPETDFSASELYFSKFLQMYCY